MSPSRNFVDFIVYSNVFIAACATAITAETFVLLHLPATLNWYLLFVFLSTLFIYSLHYYSKLNTGKTDSRLEWCRQHKRLLLAITITSLLLIAGGVWFHYQSIFLRSDGSFNLRNLIWFFAVPIVALAYSHPIFPGINKTLRQVGWLKMASLSFIWSFTTVILPLLMLPESLPGSTYTKITVLFFQRFIFIATLCLLFNIEDYIEDKADNIKTLAVVAGPAKSLLYGKWFSLLLNTIMAFCLAAAFSYTNGFIYPALLLPIAILHFQFHYFKPGRNKASFVVLHDGLMILKALLLIFAVHFLLIKT
jgi:hypothetical protein